MKVLWQCAYLCNGLTELCAMPGLHTICVWCLLLQALLQRQRLAAEAVEQEQKEEEFHLQQAQVGGRCWQRTGRWRLCAAEGHTA